VPFKPFEKGNQLAKGRKQGKKTISVTNEIQRQLAAMNPRYQRSQCAVLVKRVLSEAETNSELAYRVLKDQQLIELKRELAALRRGVDLNRAETTISVDVIALAEEIREARKQAMRQGTLPIGNGSHDN
jgi:hypothetical protein